jgi:hypothetical protein
MSCSRQPVLLVLGDSLSYYGASGGLPADDPRIWPNLVAAELGWRSHLVARVGWTARDAWWALTQDPQVWAAIPQAGAVVLAVSGMDSLPSPLPTALREQLRYLRPPALRRVVRKAYQRAQPVLSPLGWPMALPPKLTAQYLEDIRAAIAAVRPDVPVIGTLPGIHNSRYYGYAHPGRERTLRAVAEWGIAHDVPMVDVASAIADHVRSGAGNPDGIHWGFAGHRAVSRLMLAAVAGRVQSGTSRIGR